MPDIPEDPTQSEWLVLDLLDKLNNLFDQAKKDLVKIIDPGETKTSTKPLLQQQLDKVDNIFKTVNLNGKDIIGPHMSQSYEHGQMYAAIRLGHSEDDIQRATWKKVGGHVIEAQSNFKGLTDDVAKNVRRVIADGITNERTVKQISKDIRDQVDTIGKTRADMIARTETMKAVNVGVKDKYRSAGIEVVRWLATIQPGRTCEECMALNGKQFPIDKTPPIPKHPRCRCTLSPVPDPDWSEVEGWDGEQVTPPKEKKKEGPLPTTKDDFERAAEIGNEQKEILVKSEFLKEDEEISDTIIDELKPSEIDALEKYDYSSSDLANYMRGKEYDLDQFADLPDEDELSDLEYIIHRIIFNSDPLPKDLQLYRGVGGVAGKTISKLDVGDVIYDKAFSSFSYRPDQAIFFTNVMRNETEGTIIKIVTTGKESGFVWGSKNGEIILDRETTIKIIKKESIVFSDKKFTVLSGVVEHG